MGCLMDRCLFDWLATKIKVRHNYHRLEIFRNRSYPGKRPRPYPLLALYYRHKRLNSSRSQVIKIRRRHSRMHQTKQTRRPNVLSYVLSHFANSGPVMASTNNRTMHDMEIFQCQCFKTIGMSQASAELKYGVISLE